MYNELMRFIALPVGSVAVAVAAAAAVEFQQSVVLLQVLTLFAEACRRHSVSMSRGSIVDLSSDCYCLLEETVSSEMWMVCC